MDIFIIVENHDIGRSELESDDRAVALRPFGESGSGVSRWPPSLLEATMTRHIHCERLGSGDQMKVP